MTPILSRYSDNLYSLKMHHDDGRTITVHKTIEMAPANAHHYRELHRRLGIDQSQGDNTIIYQYAHFFGKSVEHIKDLDARGYRSVLPPWYYRLALLPIAATKKILGLQGYEFQYLPEELTFDIADIDLRHLSLHQMSREIIKGSLLNLVMIIAVATGHRAWLHQVLKQVIFTTGRGELPTSLVFNHRLSVITHAAVNSPTRHTSVVCGFRHARHVINQFADQGFHFGDATQFGPDYLSQQY